MHVEIWGLRLYREIKRGLRVLSALLRVPLALLLQERETVCKFEALLQSAKCV